MSVSFEDSENNKSKEIKKNKVKSKKKSKEQSIDQEWHEGEHLDPREAVYKRPEIYIGNMKARSRFDWIFQNGKIIYKEINGNEALEHLFYEVYANVIDNIKRSKDKGFELTKAKFYISENEITVWNNGYVLPFGKFRDKKTNTLTELYNVEAAFSQLSTSSNYNDNIKRTTIGKNGLGVKIVNIMSKKFTVKTYDKKQDTLYEQTWSDNMQIVGKPKIKTGCKLKELKELNKDDKDGFTQVSFTPEFEKFGVKQFSQDMIDLFTKYIYDFSMNTNLPCYLNDTKISISFMDYVRLYPGLDDTKELLKLESDDCDVILCPGITDELTCISFVNGGITRDGGVHCDKWVETIFRPIVEAVNNKGKRKKVSPKKKGVKKAIKKDTTRYKVNIKDVKNYFTLFIKAIVENPGYDSQSKNRLTEPDVKSNISEKEVKKIMKWEFASKIEDFIKMKNFGELKKLENKKRVHVANDSYDRANLIGKSKECILIIVEGLSAKEMINHGIRVGLFGKKGRDYIGIFCVQGKVLNCRGSSSSQIMKNKTITQLIHALGVKFDTDYSEDDNFDTLLYSKVVICTDSDVDGFHICGLLQNFFDSLFPSLLKRDYLYNMKTPIVKMNINKELLMYYNYNHAKKYIKDNQVKKNNIFYLKGLGSWSTHEVPLIFGKYMMKYNADNKYKITMDDAFNGKKSNRRKMMMSEYEEKEEKDEKDEKDESGKEYNKIRTINFNISDFINTELIQFFIDNCKRMIPNIYDGLKESQRKILHLCFKRKLYYNKKEIKVSQLAGAVSENTSYHHGENNLYDNISRLCQTFPGSNNINILHGVGQLGTRYTGQPSQSRYTFTKISKITPYIFREEDFNIIRYLEDEGLSIEPEFYVPIIPMVLINGCRAGIGVGYSSNIPCYNPIDLVNWIKRWLKDEKINGYKPELARFVENYIISNVYKLETRIKINEVRDYANNYGRKQHGENKNTIDNNDGMVVSEVQKLCDDFINKNSNNLKLYSTLMRLNYNILYKFGSVCGFQRKEENKEGENENNKIIFEDENQISLLPWYRGFKGEIGYDEKGVLFTRGIIKEGKKNNNEYIITELPIGTLIESFKNDLDKMLANKEIKSMKNNSSEEDENSIKFTVIANEDGLKPSVKTLGLESKISTNNMTLFTKNFKIKQYKDVEDILEEFCYVRYEYYTKRKNYLLSDLKEQLKYVSNRYRFAKEVMEETLILRKRKKADIVKEMEDKKYDKKKIGKNGKKDEDEEEEEREEKEEKEEKGMSYEYLLRMRIDSVTVELLEKLLKEKGNIEDKIKQTQNTGEKEMWEKELNEFLIEYHKIYKGEEKKIKKGKKKDKENEDLIIIE